MQSAGAKLQCRLIIDGQFPGARNMAIDEAQLLDAAENGIATLRFYEWSEPTLSLGYFQHYDDRHGHAASRDCAIVRRQTGGGAILHDRELTYSIALPPAHPLARNADALYSTVHEAFVAELEPELASYKSQARLFIRRECPKLPPDREPFLCFQRRASGDVVYQPVEQQRSDCKILGSAQRRHRGAILQHGSLLLQKSPAAPEVPGLQELTGLAVTAQELAVGLSIRIGAILGLELVKNRLRSALELKAEELANSKYGAAGWTKRR
jgi:lipoate-protein ligase A